MPIVDDDQIKSLLADEQITAITVDTSIFDQKRLQLNSTTMQALAGLKERPLSFMLSDTVAKEVLAHLEKAADEALQAAKKAIGQALFAFETENPTRNELLQQISGGLSAKETAQQRWSKYIDDTGCEILTDASIVNVSTIYDGYFAGEPPFGPGKKKDEFPDALALYALEKTASDRGAGIIVVSNDGDWRAFCETSQNLYLVPKIERALALITNAPFGLRKAVCAWILEGGEGHQEVQRHIEHGVERLEFTANAHPTHGEVEISTWTGQLKEVVWPEVSEIDLIEIVETGEGDQIRVVVSLPLDFIITVLVELSFSFWDGVDRESISMGGRSIEIEHEVPHIRATIALDVHNFGTDDEDIVIEDAELDSLYYEIDLGTVDVFEREDYWDGEEQN